jgi:hypothetical protein
MIQLTWRQFRTQAAVAYGLLAVIAIVLAITGPKVAHFYDAYVATCAAHNDCNAVQSEFLRYQHAVQAALGPVLLILPALIGMFWGAPLIARELETGTYRLAWTQSLTRGRWLAIKLGLLGLASMAAAGLLSLMVTWWFSPLDRMNLNRFTPGVFDERGVVPVGYAAFAFMAGVLAGVLIRRTVPAMGATIAVYLGARIGVTYGIRPSLMTPLHLLSPLSLGNGSSGPSGSTLTQQGPGAASAPNPADWVLSDNTVNAAGRVIGQAGGVNLPNGMQGIGFQPRPDGVWLAGVGRCPNIPAGTPFGPGTGLSHSGALQTCVDKLGVHQDLVYQPISRFWDFQWCELGIFLAAALLLAGCCFWWVRRRLT